MKKALVAVGISASGKSTEAREWVAKDPVNRVEINRDEVRKALYEATSKGKPFTWAKWKWSREGEVTTICDTAIQQAADIGKDIFVSDTNLSKATREGMVRKLTKLGYEVEIKEFPITLEEAWKRDAQRANGVGHSVIAQQHEKYLEYSGRKKYVADQSKPKCILVDIDGTAGHANGKRGMFEWMSVKVDTPDESVRLIVNSLPSDVAVIFMSGRDSVCRELTQEWLDENNFRNAGLFMRPENDMRKDTVIKEELFWEHIAPNYNVLFCIDDRPCVCRFYRELNIKVFQVGNPHVEF